MCTASVETRVSPACRASKSAAGFVPTGAWPTALHRSVSDSAAVPRNFGRLWSFRHWPQTTLKDQLSAGDNHSATAALLIKATVTTSRSWPVWEEAMPKLTKWDWHITLVLDSVRHHPFAGYALGREAQKDGATPCGAQPLHRCFPDSVLRCSLPARRQRRRPNHSVQNGRSWESVFAPTPRFLPL